MINGRESLEVKAECKTLRQGVSAKLNAAKHTFKVHSNRGHRKVVLKEGQTSGIDFEEMWHEGKEVLPWMKHYYVTKGKGYHLGDGWKGSHGVVYNVWTSADGPGIDDRDTPSVRLDDMGQLDAFLSSPQSQSSWKLPSKPKRIKHSAPSDARHPFIRPMATRKIQEPHSPAVKKNPLPDICLATTGSQGPLVDVTNVNLKTTSMTQEQKEAMWQKRAREQVAKMRENGTLKVGLKMMDVHQKADERRAEVLAEQQRAKEAKIAAEEKNVEERKATEERCAEERKVAEEKKRAVEEKKAEERRVAEDRKKAEEKQKQAEAKRILDEQKVEEERIANEKKAAEKKRIEEQQARVEDLEESLAAKREDIEAKQQELEDLRDVELSSISSDSESSDTSDEEIQMKMRELEKRKLVLAKKREAVSDLETDVSTSEDESNDVKARARRKKSELNTRIKANTRREQAMEKRGQQLAENKKNQKNDLFTTQMSVHAAYVQGTKSLKECPLEELKASVEEEMERAAAWIKRKEAMLRTKEQELAAEKAQRQIDGLKMQMAKEQKVQESLLVERETKLQALEDAIEVQRAEIEVLTEDYEKQMESIEDAQKQHETMMARKSRGRKSDSNKAHSELRTQAILLDDRILEAREAAAEKQNQMKAEFSELEHEMQTVAKQQELLQVKERKVEEQRQQALEKVRAAKKALQQAQHREQEEEAELEKQKLAEEESLHAFKHESEAKRRSIHSEIAASKKLWEEEETSLKQKQKQIEEAVAAERLNTNSQDATKKASALFSQFFTQSDSSSEDEAVPKRRPSNLAVVKAGKVAAIEMPGTPSTNNPVSEGSIDDLLASAKKSLRKSEGRKSEGRKSGRRSNKSNMTVAETVVTGLPSPPKRRTPQKKKSTRKKSKIVDDDATTCAPSSVVVAASLPAVTAQQAQHITDDDDAVSKATGLTTAVQGMEPSPVRRPKKAKKAKTPKPVVEDDQTVVSTEIPTKQLEEVKAAQAELFSDTMSGVTTATAMTCGVSKALGPAPVKRDLKPKTKASKKALKIDDDDAMTAVSAMIPTKELLEVTAMQVDRLNDDTASTCVSTVSTPLKKKSKTGKRKADAMEEDDAKSVESAVTGVTAVVGPKPTKPKKKERVKAGKKKVAKLDDMKELEEVQAKQEELLKDDTLSVASAGVSICSEVNKALGPDPVKAGKGKRPPVVPSRKRKSMGKTEPEACTEASPPKKSRKSVRFSHDVNQQGNATQSQSQSQSQDLTQSQSQSQTKQPKRKSVGKGRRSSTARRVSTGGKNSRSSCGSV